MAVTVLLGKAGSGKSTQCYREIQACAAAGGKTLLLVPDQATYGAERHLAESSDGQGFLGTQVVGFSRLAYKVFQERGLEHASLSELARKSFCSACCTKGRKNFPSCRRRPGSRILPIRQAASYGNAGLSALRRKPCARRLKPSPARPCRTSWKIFPGSMKRIRPFWQTTSARQMIR